MESYEGWAIVEIMGHRRLAGYCREAEMYGGKLLRIDSYEGDSETAIQTQYYGAGSIYCLTPATEETARRVAAGIKAPEPVALWEIPQAKQLALTDGNRWHEDPGSDDDRD